MNITKTIGQTVNTAMLPHMMAVAQVSIDLWHAEVASSMARDAYIQSIWRYEDLHGPLKGRLSADVPEHAGARKFTAQTYKMYQASKREVYAAKRKLKTACGKLAVIQAGATALTRRGLPNASAPLGLNTV